MDTTIEILNSIDSYANVLNLFVTAGIALLGFLISTRSRRIESLLTWGKARDELRAFANATIEAMTDVEGLCEADPAKLGDEYWVRYNSVLTRLSCLRDQGRLLLPSQLPSRAERKRSKAYEGIRDRALVCIKVAFYATAALDFYNKGYNRDPIVLCDENNANSIQVNKLCAALASLPDKPALNCFDHRGWSCKRLIVEAKRQFVCEMECIIDPSRWKTEMAKIAG